MILYPGAGARIQFVLGIVLVVFNTALNGFLGLRHRFGQWRHIGRPLRRALAWHAPSLLIITKILAERTPTEELSLQQKAKNDDFVRVGDM